MTPSGTLYWGRYLLPFDGFSDSIAEGGVYVEAGTGHIEEVGDAAALRARHPGAREVGGTDRVVMPGLIDAHQHGRALVPSQLGCRDEELELWLLEQRSMPRVDPALSAMIAAARSVLGGVTTLVHPHVSANRDNRQEEAVAVARAYVRSGARVTFGIDIRDRASFTYADDADFLRGLPRPVASQLGSTFTRAPRARLDELDEELSVLRAETAGTLVHVVLAPRGPQWCSERTLRWIADQHRAGTGIQMHCSETRAQYGWFAQSGDSPVRFLERYGLLSASITLAHCVWLDERDVSLLAGSGARVVHNPSSNLRLGSGRAPVATLRRVGVPVAIGTDSVGLVGPPDVFDEIRLARWLEQAPAGRFTSTPTDALAAALGAGAVAANLPERVGVLSEGAAADIVLLDLPALSRGRRAEPPSGFVHELVAEVARRKHVTDVVVGGRQVVREGHYLPLDLVELEQELSRQARHDPATAAHQLAVRQLRPYVDSELRRLHELTAGISFVA